MKNIIKNLLISTLITGATIGCTGLTASAKQTYVNPTEICLSASYSESLRGSFGSYGDNISIASNEISWENMPVNYDDYKIEIREWGGISEFSKNPTTGGTKSTISLKTKTYSKSELFKSNRVYRVWIQGKNSGGSWVGLGGYEFQQ